MLKIEAEMDDLLSVIYLCVCVCVCVCVNSFNILFWSKDSQTLILNK